MSVRKYLSKRFQKCDMCKETYTNSRFFEWIGIITEERLEICFKCAQREIGSAKKCKIRLKEMCE